MNTTIKRYLISTLRVFVSGFTSYLVAIGTLDISNTKALMIGAVSAGVSAVLKLAIEGLQRWSESA